MRRRIGYVLAVLAAAAGVSAIVALVVAYSRQHPIAVLDPKGPSATSEYHLILLASGLSLVVVVPVFGLLIAFAVRYRARDDEHQPEYRPELRNNPRLEVIWWLLPSALIVFLSFVTWTSTHQLDEYAPIPSSTKAITIQVVAMDWKWLFIYPDGQVATVNSLEIPVNTPVHLLITSDGPMNSLWIPQLAGQIYAMPGMETQLYIEASATGSYGGVSANLSGDGFAGMDFNTHAVSSATYTAWLTTVQRSTLTLSAASYDHLRLPSENVAPADYRLADPSLFQAVISRYMPTGSSMAGG